MLGLLPLWGCAVDSGGYESTAADVPAPTRTADRTPAELARDTNENNRQIAEIIASDRAKKRARVEEPLARFAESDDCASPDLASAREAALADQARAGSTGAGLEYMQFAGSLTLDVADAARNAGCREIAETLYDDVIKTFVGSGYAALRQRAELGIQRL